MCGIVGVMKGGMTESTADLFEQLLYADVFRGPHSTGVFRVNPDGQSDVLKDNVPAAVFLDYQDWADFRGGVGTPKPTLLSPVYVGHNRWATVGATTAENAHPFKVGDITMVHNGTVAKYRLKNHLNYEVDSHAVCAMLSTDGLEETLKVLDGKFTLVWHDASDNTVNFIRNAERPLHMMEFTDGSWAFASEGEMLSWINGRRRTPLTVKRAFEMPVGYHHKFQISTGKVELVEVVKHELPKYFAYTGSTSSYYSNGSRTATSSSASGNVSKPLESQEDRKARLLEEYSIDMSGYNVNEIYVTLDNIAFTRYATNSTMGRIDAVLSMFEEELDVMREDKLEIAGRGDANAVELTMFGVTEKDWRDIYSLSETLYAKIESVYESTTAGVSTLRIGLKGLETDESMTEEMHKNVFNSLIFPVKLVEEVTVSSDAAKSGTDADKSSTVVGAGNSGATGLDDAGTVGTGTQLVLADDVKKFDEISKAVKAQFKQNPPDDKKVAPVVGKPQLKVVGGTTEKKIQLYNRIGVPYSLESLQDGKLSCGWCNAQITADTYQNSDNYMRTHICGECAEGYCSA